MTKKFKKIILSLATLTTVVAPVATAISCEASSPKSDGGEWWQKLPPQKVGGGSNGLTSPNFERYRDLTPIKEFFVSRQSEYPDVTEANLKLITPTDVNNFSVGKRNKIDPTILKTMNQVDAGLVAWGFENNRNWSSIKLLNDFIKNSSQSATNLVFGSRGSLRSSDSQGVKRYYRNDVLSYKTSTNTNGIELVGSEFINGNDRTIQMYNSYTAPEPGSRRLDNTFVQGNSFSLTDSSAATFSVFREQQEGEDKSASADDSSIVWLESAKHIAKLTPGLNLEVGGKIFKGKDGISQENVGLGAELDNPSNHEITLTVDPGTKYAHVSGGKVTQSKYNLKGKDFYYGFVRQLYVIEELRSKGKRDGLDIGLPAFTTAELANIDSQFGGHETALAFDNNNAYIFDLFGVDLKATVEANESAPDDKFILKFEKGHAISQNVINFFTDSNMISPAPSERIKELANGAPISEPGKHFGLTTYGVENLGSASLNVEGEYYSVSPYVWTKYSWAENSSKELSKNHFYIDQEFVKNTKKVEKYITTQNQSVQDAAAYATSRQQNFLDAKSTHEYILDTQVLSQPSLLKDLANYVVLSKPSRIAPISHYFAWNSFATDNSGFNELGYKLLWGKSTPQEINASPDAYSEFVNGSGASTRSVINDAINWHTVVQEFFQGQGKEFYPGIVQEESLETSKMGAGDAWAEYYSSTSDMASIYEKNQSNKDEAYKSPHFKWDAEKMEELANSVGATAQNQVQIPIFRYEFSGGATNPDSVKAVEEQVLVTLNKLSPKVKFVWQNQLTWSDFVTQSVTNKTYPTMFISFGPDYSGAGSILQQYVGAFGTNIEFEFVKEAFTK